MIDFHSRSTCHFREAAYIGFGKVQFCQPAASTEMDNAFWPARRFVRLSIRGDVTPPSLQLPFNAVQCRSMPFCKAFSNQLDTNKQHLFRPEFLQSAITRYVRYLCCVWFLFFDLLMCATRTSLLLHGM